MKGENTPQAGSYEASLTEEERFTLHLLFNSGESLHEMRGKTIRGGTARTQGKAAVHCHPVQNQVTVAYGTNQ